MSDITFSTHGREEVNQLLPEIAPLYESVYTEPPYNAAPLFSSEEFLARTGRQLANDGFSLVVARDGGLIVGFSFGLPFGTGWWKGGGSPPPQYLLRAKKFAVIELVVSPQYRGQGIGKGLLNLLLEDRTELYAILTSVPEAPAHAMYLRWGWQKVGTSKANAGAPEMHVLALKLDQPV